MSLEILRNLKPVTFDFIVETQQNNSQNHGFIAQDVKKLLPNAIKKINGHIENFTCFIELKKDILDENIFISNFYSVEGCPKENIIFYPKHDNDENEYKTVDGGPASDKNGNQNFLIKIVNMSNGKLSEVYTSKIINDKQFLIDATHEKNKQVNISEGLYYLVGQEVDDLLTVNETEIISILTSSVQKIEIEQQLDKARITELETKVSEQQSIINNIIERLNNIGA